MITIGVDAHKGVHQAVAIDAAGREVGTWRGPNSASGWEEMRVWAVERGAQLRWGIEGAWNYGRGLAQHLVARGEVVFEVNPRWTAQIRRQARRAGKNDRLDARAVATLVHREAATLHALHEDDECALLELLVAERSAVMAESVRLTNQLHQLLLQADPAYRGALPRLRSPQGVRALEEYQPPQDTVLQRERAACIRRVAARLHAAMDGVADLQARIECQASQRFAPLTEIVGVSLLTAGVLASILGPGQRFTNDAQLAAYAGVAPLEASSAGLVRHRLNRGGNRHLNSVLFRIAVTQIRLSPDAGAYVARRMSEGKTRREAVRALKRFVVRSVWRRWNECLALPSRFPRIAAA